MEVSATLISNVTEAVMDEVRKFQARPLEAVYPIVYLDCLVGKVRENQRVANTSVYLALGVNLSGYKEVTSHVAGPKRGRPRSGSPC